MTTLGTRSRGVFVAALLATALAAPAATAASGGTDSPASYWLVTADTVFDPPPASRSAAPQATAKPRAEDAARLRWWTVGGPAYRWNEIVLEELQADFVTLPLAARHLALFHAAVADAMEAARRQPGSASAQAAAAAAAGEVLAALFPARKALNESRAEVAIQARLAAAAETPAQVEAGRAIGLKVAALALARGRQDGSDAKWTGSVPEGPGQWTGVNPIAPAAAGWRTWVLASPSELRPAPPPNADTPAMKAALGELKSFQRTPRSNHRALFWEVNGGARAHVLWNELARQKLLETGASPAEGARVLAALNIAFSDAAVACWDAKYAYWVARPHQLDPEVKPLFPPPNHPSFPAAHGCLSSAAATVLAQAFPIDREAILALGREAGEARIWAGIHTRFDVEAGAELGRKIGERVIARSRAEAMR
ncbi:vanadium-dependent haloperoxidase [Alsobacter sp. SYSU M60028]|uniref:Vanadium-dependent haloperoxidase n=1 Tax=Alsobacter ponti TaxID=2962936 RepID=A0ABT1L9J8_9HYPH|nr:vanadium-dependent haloperoxidase [Alsobacter ponti]MCP8937613.1 vanadium-dependent haloperoxidase [Alsobacter ponti]